MDINKLINDVASRLSWPVSQTQGEADLEIISDPWTKTHTIKNPTSGSAPRPIEILHEFAHATLAERHHLLSTAFFTGDIVSSDVSSLINPFRTASDWLADNLLMEWCPEEEKAEITEHANYVLRFNPGQADEDLMYMGGLMLAQAIKYVGMDERNFPSGYYGVVNVLLSIDPIYDVQIKQKLVNGLAALTTPLRVELVNDEGVDVWKIIK